MAELKDELPEPLSPEDEAAKLYPISIEQDNSINEYHAGLQLAHIACATKYQSQLKEMGLLLMDKDAVIEARDARIAELEREVKALEKISQIATEGLRESIVNKEA